ncbi:hypothetical protein NLG97_g3067 [Lecanicillium saksenae]|uniref:Uncharacterized protein n=1 Tax=Lecanicillium saksenae TaxID=468837 RepID=A0ACC1R1T4_9HYPO|nr:hypothetical protein NLG97_g3067 [Lecanicillium saksenae]
MNSSTSSEALSGDADFEAILEKIHQECISGPYPEHPVRVFPRWNDCFQLNISKVIRDSAKTAESMVLLRPPPLGDASPWLAVLFQLQLPNQENKWRSTQLLETPGWMVGESLIMVQRLDDMNDWSMVRAVCHVAYGPESYQAALVHLYALARCTFQSQPLRPFLYGILIYKSTFELWTFDRSGMYVSQALDLGVAYLDAVSFVVGLSLMAAKSLGVEGIIQRDKSSQAPIMFLPGEVLELSPSPIVAPRDIFGDGLLCYYARKQNEQRWTHTLKFKWRHDFKTKEEELFPAIRENGIAGVASLVYHGMIASTADLRSGVRHQTCRSLLKMSEVGRHGRGIEKHSILTSFRFRNRTCMCFVFTPLGLPLSTFRGPSELLVVLRDAIQAHRDLLQKANILHGDISSSNILIEEHTRKGLLIDFDAAIDLSRCTPTGKSFAATLEFLAVGLARGDPNTYRHDLESFFYVLLRVVACNKGLVPAGSRLNRWAADDWEEAIAARAADMQRDNFELLLNEWDPRFEKCKKLAWKLWKFLFRNDNDLFWGTDASEDGTHALDESGIRDRPHVLDITADNILHAIADDGILESFVQSEVESPTPRKKVYGAPGYLSRRFGLPEEFGRIILSDFGEVVDGDVRRTHNTQPNVYRSPEVMLQVPWSYPIDIWNVGAMIWDVFEGGHPFHGHNTSPGKGYYTTKAHLAEIIGLLGPPPVDFMQRGNRTSEFFSETGQ